MNLGALLEMLRGPILNDRSDRVDGSSDYLWTDAQLVTFINEAQRRFAARSLIIRDGTTDECCKLILREGVEQYDLHQAVIAVVSAKVSTDTSDLIRLGHEFFAPYRRTDDLWADLAMYTGLPPGAPRAYSTDEQVVIGDDETYGGVSLRIYPVPDAAADGTVIRLRVVRKPLDELTASNLSAVPEIPSDHHLEMLDWAAYLALRIVDNDAGDPRRASEFAQAFENHVQAARDLVIKKLFAPQGVSFGRNGWAWGS